MWMTCLALWAGLAMAQEPAAETESVQAAQAMEVPATPAHRLYYTNASFARVNPLGLIDLFRVGWRAKLSDSDHILLADTYTFVAAEVMATPAYSRIGIFAEAQALSVLRVFANYSGVAYFGTFDQALSWPDGSARYSDQTIEAEGDRASPTLGSVFTAGGTLRAAAGPIALRSTASWTRYDLDLPDGDNFFYDQYWDRLAPDGGWMVLVENDVMWLGEHARIGVRHSFTDTLDPRASGDGALANHRVGPLLAWQFKNKPVGERFNQPTAFLVTQWWVAHPYRAGGEQPAGFPLIALGFAFNGDLATSAP